MLAEHGVTPDDLEAATGGRVLAGDAAAEALLDRAAADVVDMLGWCPWPNRTETLTLDSRGTSVLTLPTTLVDDVAAVVVDTTPVDPAGYRWSADGLIERVRGIWPRGYRRVTVTLTHGRDDLPSVRGVILSLASRRAATPLGQTSVRAGGVSETYGPFMADELGVLDRYKIGGGGHGV